MNHVPVHVLMLLCHSTFQQKQQSMGSELQSVTSKFQDVTSELKDVKSELKDVTSELQDVKSELQDVKSELQDVKSGNYLLEHFWFHLPCHSESKIKYAILVSV